MTVRDTSLANKQPIHQLALDAVTLIRGERVLQRAISHHMDGGEITLLTGPNGCGKSSLLRAIAGRLQIAAGEISCNAAKIYVGHADGLSPALDAHSNLADWAAINDCGTRNDRITAALNHFDATGFATIPITMLSRGQRRRIALCRLLLGPPDALWLMDEPNVGLDTTAIARLDDAISAHLERGGMVLAATHLPLGPKGKNPCVRKLVLSEPNNE